MCGRPTTLGVLALMVAADGAHGLRTRAPGRRCPPRPPTTILRRSARCVAQLLIVFVIHPGWSTVDVLQREERVQRAERKGSSRGRSRGACPWGASPQPVGAVRGDHKGEDAE